MKIGHPPVKKLAPPTTAAASAQAAVSDAAAKGTAAAAASSSTAIPAKADDSAKIALSSGAKTLLSGSGNTDFDAEKVSRISKSIEDGSFKVSPEAIADKMIANAKEVLTKP